MSALLAVNDENLIGDALNMYPALTELRRRWDGDMYLYAANSAVRDLVKPFGAKRLDELSVGVTKAKVVRASVSAAFSAYVHTYHMIQAYYAVLGLPIPAVVPRVDINVNESAPTYDYVISPWSRSDHNHNKAWFVDRWIMLIDKLEGNSVAIVGADDDQRPFPLSFLGDDFHYEYGKPLAYVAGLLRNARKATITIDNGVSHLAFHVQAERHILLYPKCLPPQWVTNPNATILRNDPCDITVDDVFHIVESNT